jgi:single-strand DNA-binding protein
MRSVNKVILVGNLTRNPELKQTTNGQSIVTFGLATNREWVINGTEKKSLAEYHNIAAWGTLAEICGKYLKKGKLVYIDGYLKTRSWDSPEGAKIFKTEIVATDMIMLDKKPQGEEEIAFSEFLPGEGDNNIEPENV